MDAWDSFKKIMVSLLTVGLVTIIGGAFSAFLLLHDVSKEIANMGARQVEILKQINGLQEWVTASDEVHRVLMQADRVIACEIKAADGIPCRPIDILTKP